MTRSVLVVSLFALGLAACGDLMGENDDSAASSGESSGQPASERPDLEARGDASAESEGEIRDALEAAINSDLRSEAAKARDKFRHPVETLLFFGVEPDDTVVEVWPGGGWYTDILAPFLAKGGGKLYAASFDPDTDSERMQQALQNFDAKYVGKSDVYGNVERSVLAPNRQDIAPDGSADVVLTFRNVHNFVFGNWAPEAFAAFYEALKPGGILGVVDHRLPEDADKAREQSSGYLKVSTVRQLAEDAGFVFDGSSEVNANPMDDTDHPFGVWSLPPTSRTTGRSGDAPEGFDPAEYLAIGESDRMTLRFRKPVEPEGALLE